MQVLSCLDTFQHLDAHSSDWYDLPNYIQNPLNIMIYIVSLY